MLQSLVQSSEAHSHAHPRSNGCSLTGLWNSPGVKAGVGREQPRRSNKAAVKSKGDKRRHATEGLKTGSKTMTEQESVISGC